MPNQYSSVPEYARYDIDTRSISRLEGQLLTLIDATVADQIQRKATKDILREKIWDWACPQMITGEGNQDGKPAQVNQVN